MTVLLGRRASLELTYNNSSVTPHLKTWTYTDNLSGNADDISLTLEDKQHQWMGAWAPKKGITIQASLVIQEISSLKKDLGAFEIDTFGVQGPPSEVTISGISVPSSSSIRREDKYGSWEKTTLKKIAQDIATRNKLSLFWEVTDTIQYDRKEQNGDSDLKFLMGLCESEGLALKVTNKQVIIIDEYDYEVKTPQHIIHFSDKNILDYKGDSTLDTTYRACRVEYKTPKQKNAIKYTFVPPNAPSVGRTLVVNQQVSSKSEAIRKAKASLRNENKNANTFSIKLRGIGDYYAGMTISLSGFGVFDGKYIVTALTISGGNNGTISSLELRKCLVGY